MEQSWVILAGPVRRLVLGNNSFSYKADSFISSNLCLRSPESQPKCKQRVFPPSLLFKALCYHYLINLIAGCGSEKGFPHVQMPANQDSTKQWDKKQKADFLWLASCWLPLGDPCSGVTLPSLFGSLSEPLGLAVYELKALASWVARNSCFLDSV